MYNQQRTLNLNNIFRYSFIESKSFFMYCYQQPPCITWVDRINADKVLRYMKDEYGDAITGIYQYSKYSRSSRKIQYDTTLITLRDNCLVEIAGSYVEILHTIEDYTIANELIKELSRFKRIEKKKDFEINLVTKDYDGLDLKVMDIKKTNLDLGLYYEDDFLPVHKTILERLNKRQDKGIVLLHGLPGTGKPLT